MLLKHSFIYLLSRVVTIGTTFLSLWLFSRLYAPAEFGVYTTVMAIATVASVSLFQWIRITLMRFLHHDGMQHKIMGVALWLFLVTVGVTALAAPFSLFMPEGAWQHIILFALAVTWAQSASEISLILLRTRLKPWSFFAFSALRDGAQLALSLLFILNGWHAEGLMLAVVIANILPVILWFPSTWKGGHIPKRDPQLLRDFCTYGLPLAAIYTIGTLVGNAERLILPVLVSAEAAGLYGAAAGLARQTLTALMMTINMAAFPLAIAAYKKGDHTAAKQEFEKAFLLLLGIALPAAAGLAVLAHPIAHFLLGAAYAPAAAKLLPWLALAAFLQGMRSYYTDQAFQLVNETKKSMINNLITGCLTLPLSAWMIWRYGLDGAAYGMTLGFALSLALSWFGQTTFKLPLPRRESLWIIAATLLMIATLWPFRHSEGFLPLTGSMMLGGSVYVLTLLMGNVRQARTLLLKKLKAKGQV